MWSTREWAPHVLDALADMAPIERLCALRELLWRWNIQLEPMSALEPVWLRLEDAVRDVMRRIDCQAVEIDGNPAPEADWFGIFESWIAVASALLTATRFRFDSKEFEQLVSILTPLADKHEELRHHIPNELCLRAVYLPDYAKMEKILEDWNTDDADPVWMMRKAALLFEIGHEDKAEELNTAALASIRTVSLDDPGVAHLSYEAWALFCAGTTLGNEEYWQATIERQRRWDELTNVKCNAGLELHYYAEAIKGERTPDKGQPFDLGIVWKEGISFSQKEYLRWTACHRALRVADVAGLPPSVRRVDTASSMLSLAAIGLTPHEPELAARVAVRAAKDEKTEMLNSVLSRVRVASISKEAANRLIQDCILGIDFILRRMSVSDPRDFWINRLRVIMEALSRCVIRLDPERVDPIFARALGWYENKVLSSTYRMGDAVRNVLSRCWEALPDERRAARFLDLVSAPLVGIGGFAAGVDSMLVKRYPDTSDVLSKGRTPTIEKSLVRESQWNAIIEFLLKGLRGQEETRRRAARRLSWLVDVKSLPAEGLVRVGQALWGEDYENMDGLPSGTDLHDWAFVVMPEPSSGLGEQRFRAKWLSSVSSVEAGVKKPGEVLWQVGSAIGNLEFYGKNLTFSDQERSYLEDVVGGWAQEPLPAPLTSSKELRRMFANDTDNDVRKAIYGLQCVLLEVQICTEVADALYKKFKELNESTMPARGLAAGLVTILPERFDDIVQSVRTGLASDKEEVARDAVRGLEFWMQADKQKIVGLRGPPADLVREVGLIIATRRKAALANALQVAKWMMSEGTPEEKATIGSQAAQGLGYLAQELEYDQEHDDGLDVPLLRWNCMQLAAAMAEHGFDSQPSVRRWIENARDDPLPEIRHVKVPLVSEMKIE